MQTRLRTRLGLSAGDALPDPTFSGVEPSSSKKVSRRSQHGQLKVKRNTTIPRTQWRHVFTEITQRLSARTVSLSECDKRSNGLQGELTKLILKRQHEHRMALIAEGNEEIARKEMLEAARERTLKERKKHSVANAPIDSNIEGSLCEDDDNDETSNDPSLRILKIVDEIDRQMGLFAQRNEEIALRSASDKLKAAPPVREGRKRGSAAPRFSCVMSPASVEACTRGISCFDRLMDFQKEGVLWMTQSMMVQKLNCILADEMGLGKTVSTIALFSSIVACMEHWTMSNPPPPGSHHSVPPTFAARGGKPAVKKKTRRRMETDSSEGSDEDNDESGTSSVSSSSDDSDEGKKKRIVRLKKAAKVKQQQHSQGEDLDPYVIRPFLVVAPLSTIPNWEREFAEFEPDVFETVSLNGPREERMRRLDNFLKLVAFYRGGGGKPGTRPGGVAESKKKRGRPCGGEDPRGIVWGSPSTFAPPQLSQSGAVSDRVLIPVLIVPQDMLCRNESMQVRALIRDVSWQCLVVDEAQRIKSSESALFCILVQANTQQRLCLSGTPLQNNIIEMFNLMEFILPALFSRSGAANDKLVRMLNDALSRAGRKGASYDDEEMEMMLCRRVHKFLAPFLLRREKKAVASQLPVKDDVIIVCPLAATQREYLDVLDKRRERGCVTGSFAVQVKKAIIHPYLLINSYYVEERLIRASGKFLVLDILLRFLERTNHKVLVFCSWTKVLDIVESLCHLRKQRTVRLEGKTDVLAREENIKTFSGATTAQVWEVDDDGQLKSVEGRSATPNGAAGVNCFLISKIAGGVGLNLQVADTVVLLDVDYNPQRDSQALSRVYRVGQKKHVKVLRLVTDHPHEEHTLNIALQKQHLEDAVVGAGKYDLHSTGFDRDEHLRHLFRTMRTVDPVTAGDSQVQRGKKTYQDVINEQLLLHLPRGDLETPILEALLTEYWAEHSAQSAEDDQFHSRQKQKRMEFARLHLESGGGPSHAVQADDPEMDEEVRYLSFAEKSALEDSGEFGSLKERPAKLSAMSYFELADEPL